MPGRCAAPPAPAMITFTPAALRALGEGVQPVGRAVGRDDALVVGDAERVERLGGVPHGRPVGLAAHDDRDGLGHACLVVRKKARMYRNTPLAGKRTGFVNLVPPSCPAKSRRAWRRRSFQGQDPDCRRRDRATARRSTSGSAPRMPPRPPATCRPSLPCCSARSSGCRASCDRADEGQGARGECRKRSRSPASSTAAASNAS